MIKIWNHFTKAIYNHQVILVEYNIVITYVKLPSSFSGHDSTVCYDFNRLHKLSIILKNYCVIRESIINEVGTIDFIDRARMTKAQN